MNWQDPGFYVIIDYNTEGRATNCQVFTEYNYAINNWEPYNTAPPLWASRRCMYVIHPKSTVHIGEVDVTLVATKP